jgi:hypothetical protein
LRSQVFKNNPKNVLAAHKKSGNYFSAKTVHALPANKNYSQPLKNRKNHQKIPNSPT